FRGDQPVCGQQALVESAGPPDRLGEGILQLARDGTACGRNLVAAYDELLPRQVHAVPAPSVLQQRVITPRLHVLDRAARTLQDLGVEDAAVGAAQHALARCIVELSQCNDLHGTLRAAAAVI